MEKQSGFTIFKKVLFTLMNFVVIFFIFHNSSRAGELSGAISLDVMDFVNGILGDLGISYSFSHHAIRKLAHLTEFAFLGFWLMLSLRVYTRRLIAFISWPMLIGLLIAVADEFLQDFIPGRSSQVSDIIIDFAGVVVGMMCGLAIELLASALYRVFSSRPGKEARH